MAADDLAQSVAVLRRRPCWAQLVLGRWGRGVVVEVLAHTIRSGLELSASSGAVGVLGRWVPRCVQANPPWSSYWPVTISATWFPLRLPTDPHAVLSLSTVQGDAWPPLSAVSKGVPLRRPGITPVKAWTAWPGRCRWGLGPAVGLRLGRGLWSMTIDGGVDSAVLEGGDPRCGSTTPVMSVAVWAVHPVASSGVDDVERPGGPR